MENEEWLEFLKNALGGKTYKATSSVTVIKKKDVSDDKPLINVSVDKLYELYANLQMAGFSADEAILIVVGVANGRYEQ